MKDYKIKDIMVPISEYATVSQDSTLYEAVLALEKAQKEFDRSHYAHRAILIYDKNKKIIGKVSQLDVLRALEPKYSEIQDHSWLARYGFTKKFVKSMMDQYRLWDTPLAAICKKASGIKVSEIMYSPTEGEYVDENTTIDEAIHMLVMGHHQSLLVKRKDDIIGILRLTDIFSAIFHTMKECQV
jgi:CBS domain-containing protein